MLARLFPLGLKAPGSRKIRPLLVSLQTLNWIFSCEVLPKTAFFSLYLGILGKNVIVGQKTCKNTRSECLHCPLVVA